MIPLCYIAYMRHTFEDGTFVEVKKENDLVVIIVAAQDATNPRKHIINIVDMKQEEFEKMVSDVYEPK